jgi:DNA repair ATPase RecN
LSNLGAGKIIYNLRRKVQDLQSELSELINPVQEMPQLIASANLLRSNEYLTKITRKQSELLSAYANYSESLEQILATVFEIQNDLKNILREQSELISHTKPTSVPSMVKPKKTSIKSKKKLVKK